MLRKGFQTAFWIAAGACCFGSLVLAQDEALNGTVTFYPADYYSPDLYPEAAAEFEALMAEYEELHPEVTVELVPAVPTGTNYVTWLTTRLAAGQAPNIAWQQFYDRNREGSDVWVPLNDYLERPNPYVPAGQPGSERWADLFPDYVMAQTRAGDGNWYQLSMDWVETGLYVNNEVMDRLGLDSEWDSWGDFISDCTTIREAGIEPVGVFMTPEWSTYQWLDDIFVTVAFGSEIQDWYLPQYSSEFLPWRQLTQEELARAIQLGEFSTDSEQFDFYLQITKEFADNCLVRGFAGIANYDEMTRLFTQGEVAMAWLGTWTATNLLGNIQFDFDVTYLPAFTEEENPYLVHNSSYRVGGPSSTGQYGITQATADAGLLEEAVDLLMFWSAPQSFQRVYDKKPDNVPMVAGVEASELAQSFKFVAAMPERALTDPIGRLTPEFGTEHNRMFQQFMLGEIDTEQLKADYQVSLERAADDLCRDQEWAWCE